MKFAVRTVSDQFHRAIREAAANFGSLGRAETGFHPMLVFGSQFDPQQSGCFAGSKQLFQVHVLSPEIGYQPESHLADRVLHTGGQVSG